MFLSDNYTVETKIKIKLIKIRQADTNTLDFYIVDVYYIRAFRVHSTSTQGITFFKTL